MPKKKKPEEDIASKLSEVMSFMGKRSAAAREKAWVKREFKKRMKEWGKLGGRPRKTQRKEKHGDL